MVNLSKYTKICSIKTSHLAIILVYCNDELLGIVKAYERQPSSKVPNPPEIKYLEEKFNALCHLRSTYYVYLIMSGEDISYLTNGLLTFSTFMSSIKYVGKGTQNRLLQHLDKAAKLKRTQR
jgi:hypothetical protein